MTRSFDSHPDQDMPGLSFGEAEIRGLVFDPASGTRKAPVFHRGVRSSRTGGRFDVGPLFM